MPIKTERLKKKNFLGGGGGGGGLGLESIRIVCFMWLFLLSIVKCQKNKKWGETI